MAYIRCASGGGSNIEVIEGTKNGTTEYNTSFTVTSQQGKAPKIVAVWLDTPDAGIVAHSGCYWNGSYFSGKYVGEYGANATTLSLQTQNVGTNTNYYPSIANVGADSVTIKLNGVNSYCKGTMKYVVVFE